MSESDDSSTSRSRTFTEKGQQQFEDEYSKRNKHICKAYDQIANHLNRIPQCSTIEDLESVQKELATCGEKHSKLCLDLVDFCQRRGTLASKELAQTHRMTHQGCKILIDSATRQIKNRINDIAFEERSTVSSSSSKSSLRSSTSSRQSQQEIVRIV
ncbi:unnamed protein product [Mytilus edulis]|uniref:Uncharacterized protein n=1 Tax=Mytilus edulis TaxID=6550 RepID=A0A8S3UZX9_MYTED|nr:unnamed protein product [Mytilus edulis]